MSDQIAAALKVEDREFRRAYADSFLNSRLALQIRANRKARGWTQRRLAAEANKHQSQIPPLENIDNETWTVGSLLRIADAFDLVLVVKFASFGESLEDFSSMAPEDLLCPGFDDDPVFKENPSMPTRASTSAPVPGLLHSRLESEYQPLNAKLTTEGT